MMTKQPTSISLRGWFSLWNISNVFDGKQQVVCCAAEDSKCNLDCWQTDTSVALPCCILIWRNYKCARWSIGVAQSSWTLQSRNPHTPMRPTCEGGVWLRPPIRQRAIQLPPLVLPGHFYSHVCTNTGRPMRTRRHYLRYVRISQELALFSPSFLK